LVQRLREATPQTQRARSFHRVQLEIANEMATSLGRAGDKVTAALLELELLGLEIDEAPDLETRSRKVEAFNEKRKVAERALWELTVHREALGLRDNHRLREFYPIPKPRV
jgi:hypothetical protein